MSKFIEQNRRLLRTYCLLANIFGGVLLVVGCMAVMGHGLALISRAGDIDAFADYFRQAPWGVIGFLPTGYLVLALAQFLRYLLDDEYKPGWILRNAVQFAYLYAIVLVPLSIMFGIVLCLQEEQWYEVAYRVTSVVFLFGAKILFLVGLGQMLGRIMPVIEESKTLV